MLKLLLRVVEDLPIWLASTALFFLMLLTFADVVLRSVANAPIEIATDLTRVLMATVVFAVMPALSFRGGQISVDLLDGVFRNLRLARLRDIVVTLFCGVILIWPTMRVARLAERSRSYGDTTEYLRMPVFYVEWFIAVMTGLTALALLLRAVLLVVKPELLKVRHG